MWISTPCSTGSAPYAKMTRSISRSPSIRGSGRRVGRSRISGSSSRIVAIFTIAAPRRLQLAVHVRELLQRLEDELQQVERGDQRADRERVVREQRVAGVEHGAGRDDAEELDRREEDREDLLRVDVLLEVGRVQLVELAPGTRARG